MRVAALYDIHGNLPALEAVLDELAGASVDQVVVGGDVLAATGYPNPPQFDLLNPPAAESMLEIYSKAELKP